MKSTFALRTRQPASIAGARGRSRRRCCRPGLEILEDRCLLFGTLPSGIYIENFTDEQRIDDLGRRLPGFDSSGAFQHCFEFQGQTHCITDPADTPGPGYQLGTFTSVNHPMILLGATDHITFPNLIRGVHVAFVAVDVSAASDWRVRVVGQNGAFVRERQPGDAQTESIPVGEGHVLDEATGLRLGPITEISLYASESVFDDVRILVVPDSGPVARDDFATAAPGQTTTIDILDNDTDADGQPLHVVFGSVSLPAFGTVTPDGVTYTAHPNAPHRGSDSYTYTVSDPNGNTATATVHIRFNTPPIAGDLKLEGVEHGTPGPLFGQVPIADADGDPLTIELTNPPDNGRVSFGPDGRFRYDPAPVDVYDLTTGLTRLVATVRGSVQFTYRVSDGIDVSSEGTVDIVVNNFRPDGSRPDFLQDDFLVPSNNPDEPYLRYPGLPAGAVRFAAPGVLFNDIDLDDDPLTARLVAGPDHGFLILNNDGSFVYTPEPDYVGLDGFQYVSSDGFAESPVQQVTLSVEARVPSTRLRDRIPVLLDDFYAFDHHFPAIETRSRYQFRPGVTRNDEEIVPGESIYDNGFEIGIPRERGPALGLPRRDSFATETEALLPAGFVGRVQFTYALVYLRRLLSNFATVTVTINDVDTDGDGFSDGTEAGGPAGDIDAAQNANQVALPNALDSRQVTFSSPQGFVDLGAIGNPHPDDAPPGVSFPLGFFEFTVVVAGSEGRTHRVDLRLPPGITLNDYWKYGPEPEDDPATAQDETAPHWYRFLFDGTTGAQFFSGADDSPDTDRIILHFVDGGRGDDDGVVNGFITDPGAPAFSVRPPVVESVLINDGSRQRSMISRLTVSFSDLVALDPNALVLRRVGAERIDFELTTSVMDGRTVVELLLDEPLPDGDYRLKVRGARIHSLGGLMLDGNADGRAGDNFVNRFFSLLGDADGDRDVDDLDRSLFRDAYKSLLGESRFRSYFDFDGDGQINSDDRRWLKRRRGA